MHGAKKDSKRSNEWIGYIHIKISHFDVKGKWVCPQYAGFRARPKDQDRVKTVTGLNESQRWKERTKEGGTTSNRRLRSVDKGDE